MGKEFLLEIGGETPAKKNSRINLRSGRSIPSRRYMEWHGHAELEARKAMAEQGFSEPFRNPVKVSMEFHHSDMRRRDSDNQASSILDVLVDCGILEDDSWRIVTSISVLNAYTAGEAGCLVKVEDYEVRKDGEDGTPVRQMDGPVRKKN